MPIFTALENAGLSKDLALTQVHEDDRELAKEGIAAVEAEQQKREEESNQLQDESTDPEEQSAPPASDAEPAPEDQEESTEVEEIDGKQTTQANESARYESTDIVSLESFEFISTAGSKIGGAISATGALAAMAVSKLASALRDLTIAYGPGVLRFIRVTVMMLLTRSLKILAKGLIKLLDAKQRYVTSMKRHQSSIGKLKQKAIEAKAAGLRISPERKTLVNTEIAVWSSVDGRCDFSAACDRLTSFSEDIFSFSMEKVSFEIASMQRMLDLISRGSSLQINDFTKSTEPPRGLLLKTVQGYEPEYDVSVSYVYPKDLPNHAMLILTLPKLSTQSSQRDPSEAMQKIAEAYKSSSMIIGVNPASRQKQTLAVNYMEADRLVSFIEQLDVLAKLGEMHTQLYDEAHARLNKVKPGYQTYLQWLVADARQRSVQESFSELIAAKQAFINHVYLPGAMDVHEHISAFLSQAKNYVRLNLKALS